MKTLHHLIITVLCSLIISVQAQDDRLKPGDQLEIEIYGQEDMKATVPVEATGEASFRFLDPLKVKGMTLKEVRTIVTEAYKADYFQNPEVTIRIIEHAQGRVRVMGAVANVKHIVLERGQKLSAAEAIAAAGGVTALADKNKITIRSKDGKKKGIHQLAALQNAQGGQIVFLDDGDSIEVGTNANAGKTITIMGDIANPGVVAYPLDGITLETLIGISGGVKPTGLAESATITRGGRKGRPNRGMQTKLYPNDVVEIPRNPNVGKFVTMGGNIAKPGQLAFPLNGKLTVSQAIAAAGGKGRLGDLRRIRVKSGGQIREVNLKKVREGKQADIRLKPGDTVTIHERRL